MRPKRKQRNSSNANLHYSSVRKFNRTTNWRDSQQATLEDALHFEGMAGKAHSQVMKRRLDSLALRISRAITKRYERSIKLQSISNAGGIQHG